MLLKRNLLENLTIMSSSGTIICVLLNYVSDISLITGIWFPLYMLTVFIVSLILSFKCIQWLLRLNKPLSYDLDAIVKEYPYLCFLKQVIPEVKKREPYVWKEYDTNELSVISTVLERKLVSSWYVPYVSQEIGFPFACKQMLDQMIGKAFKICHKIETKDVFVDLCTILISHLKEYNKALKRQEKTPDSSIETLYKKTHSVSESVKYTSADHCTNILRILLKELLPWELWDTPHSELLVRILSKKLDAYIDNTLTNPAWINDRIVTYLTGKEYVVKDEIETEMPTSQDVKDNVDTEVTETPKASEVLEVVEEQVEKPVDVKMSPVLRQKRGRQGRNEVKIYDRIIEGSVKTWETDMDLQCISLGQDLLASLDGEITLSRLWGQDAEPESSPERQGGKSPQPLWFGDEDISVEAPARTESPEGEVAGALLKELQSTVSTAKHKIEGLQVHPADEAAGMMEGLLDFGIAGLKKGLRFTGLSDDSQNKSPSNRDRSARGSPEARHKPMEVGVNPLTHKDADMTNGAPHLVKQQRVTSQDSVTPSISVCIPGNESPELQYEETPDLSTSIAKLRCLLQQNENRGGEVWWEKAEETRGRTQQHHSTRPVDTATLADEYDMNMDRNSSPNQSTNNMQRLDKLFTRTVTGVFNSLKTAVGGEEDLPPSAPGNVTQWTFVCTNTIEFSVCGACARAVEARRSGRVDAALDSLTLPSVEPTPSDPDDLEEWCTLFGRGWSAMCGATCSLAPLSHVACKLATILFADLCESLLTSWLSDLAEYLRVQVFATFDNMNENNVTVDTKRPMDVDYTCKLLGDKFGALQVIFGSEAISQAVRQTVSSISYPSINKDVAYKALDLLALHFKTAAGLRNPSFE